MRQRRMGGAAVSLVLAAAVVAGCGDDDGGTATTTTAPPATTTTLAEATTTTAAEATTTTTAGAGALGDEPTFADDGPSGSGCTPDDPDSLPDGWWYGTLVPPAAVGEQISFDLACYYVGLAAEAVAADRGDEVTNDYYVVDDNEALRQLPVADGATASCVTMGDEVLNGECSPAQVQGDWAIWVRVSGGTVDRIVEQYAP